MLRCRGMTPGSEGKKEDEEIEWLTKIIKGLNDTYGLDLKEEDKVEFEKMKKKIYSNDELTGPRYNKTHDYSHAYQCK
jgi:type I restriction enzyme, R subunit